MERKRTIAYCDGYNLYNRLLRHTANKWLDLEAFVSILLRPDHDILTVKYFTSRVRPYPYDQQAIDRQKIYLQALTSRPKTEVIEGMYDKRKTWLPFVGEPCKSCPEMAPNHMGRVYKFEEKRTDVNLATNMLVDAALNNADCLVLISGDSDFVAAVEAVRKVFRKTVLVFNPSDTYSAQLDAAANYYKHIPRDLPAKCQLPDIIPIGTHGRTIHRPAAWA
jgi:uncharacterized LabA/DUF88 family protein